MYSSLFFFIHQQLKDGNITNDLRIRASLPTLRKILNSGGSVIAMSHLGRPTGIPFEEGKTYTPEDFLR
jgi:phosphoglycerate kinase